MEIRLFKPEDAEEVALLVAQTLKISNSKDYSPEYIEHTISSTVRQAQQVHITHTIRTFRVQQVH